MSATLSTLLFHLLAPGATLPGDWFPGRVPDNIVVGENSVIDSSFCFKHYFSRAAVGLRVGSHVTIWRASLAADERAVIEIGDHSYLANASLVCTERIVIGARVMIAGGVTVADSDFHPIAPAARLADTVALSPVGDRRRRPAVESRPVVIEDDVWVGYNATILKGVRVGAGAVVAPGALVIRDVPPGVEVAGNPARVVGG
ncbi:MAG TPA: acyltransferase [Pyrinomonadaceae bacterium]|nr:acyltransferase [Pyrinomonadaceae bacterium]